MTSNLSVILPVRNAAATLAAALESLLAQSMGDLEIELIDDGSIDATISIATEYARRDRRIRLHRTPPTGLVAALNRGLAAARGGFIARMDGDDICHPERFERQLELLRSDRRLELVGCCVELFCDGEGEIGRGYLEYIAWQNRLLTSDQIAAEIFVECPIAHPTFLFRRSLIERFGPYRAGNFPEDYELLLRLHCHKVAMARSAETLLRWRDSPGRTSRVDPRYATTAFDQLRADYLERYLNRLDSAAERPFLYWGAGRPTRKRSRLLRSRSPHFTATGWIDIDPRKIGQSLEGALVHPPDWLDKSCQHPGRRPYILCYVNNYGARQEIANRLESFHYRPIEDYLFVG